jgi:hypothetical protein
VAKEQLKWQPVMIVTNKRLECACGSLAIFVTGKVPLPLRHDDEYNSLEDVDVWCQDCFQKYQEQE